MQYGNNKYVGNRKRKLPHIDIIVPSPYTIATKIVTNLVQLYYFEQKAGLTYELYKLVSKFALFS